MSIYILLSIKPKGMIIVAVDYSSVYTFHWVFYPTDQKLELGIPSLAQNVDFFVSLNSTKYEWYWSSSL